MALGTTNISITTVKNILSAATTVLSGLSTHANINKWSKFKPVDGPWEQGTSGNYGFDLPSSWNYITPLGGIDSPYRLGDFRKYEHLQSLTLPPSYTDILKSDFDTGTTVFDSTFNFLMSAKMELNTSRVSEITIADLGLENYYFGCIITEGLYTYHKTLSTTLADNDTFTPDLSLDINGDYNNFPPNITGKDNAVIKFMISATQQSTDWASYLPSDYIILPDEVVDIINCRSIYNFEIGNWVNVDNFSPIFDPLSSGSGDYRQNIIHSNIASPDANGIIISSTEPWVDFEVRSEFGAVLTPPYYGGSEIRVWTNESNTGPYRTGNIIFGDLEGNPHSGELAAAIFSQGPGPIIVSVLSGHPDVKIPSTGTGTATVNSSNVNFSFTTGSDQGSGFDLYYIAQVDGVHTYSSGPNPFVSKITGGIITYNQTNMPIGIIVVGGEQVIIRIYTGAQAPPG